MIKRRNRNLFKRILAGMAAVVMLPGGVDAALAAEMTQEISGIEISGSEAVSEAETEAVWLETEAEAEGAEIQPESETGDAQPAGRAESDAAGDVERDENGPAEFAARAGGIPADASHFPDAVFREYVQDYIAGDDGVLSASELAGVKYLELYYEEDLKNVKGIEYFPNLQYLRLEGNRSLTALDLRKLTNLREVECSDCALTSLKVSGLTKLKKLICSANDLTSLNLSGLLALEQLECSQNALTALNVRSLSNLKYLICRENRIRTLDLSGLGSLQKADCEGNGMTSLKLGTLPALTTLLCGTNSLTSLELSNVPRLTELYCYQNKLASLDCTANTALKELEAFTNNMTALNLTGLKNLLSVNCSANRITALDVTSASGLVSLIADNNCLPAVDLSKNKKLSLASFQSQIVSAAVLQTKDGYQTDFRASGFKQKKVTGLTGAALCADGLFWKTGLEIPSHNTVTYTYKTGKTGVTVPVTVKLTGVKAWTPKPGKVNLYYVRNTKTRSLTLKWKKVSGASGYQISYGTSSKFKKAKTKTVTVKKAGTKLRVIKKLKKNKTYYVRLRAYTSYGGKRYYGAWSVKKKVKIKK